MYVKNVSARKVGWFKGHITKMASVHPRENGWNQCYAWTFSCKSFIHLAQETEVSCFTLLPFPRISMHECKFSMEVPGMLA
jgi:hypothetical protein